MISCTPKEEEKTNSSNNHLFDPRIPGGQISTDNKGLAGKVLNLTADVSQLEKITLNWQVPPIYKTMDYEVFIYKKKGNDSTFVLPDPADQYSAAPLYLRSSVVGESYLDQNGVNESNEPVINVEQNQIYTYWVYLKLKSDSGEKWSPGVKIVVTSKSPTDTFKFPSVSDFWNNLLWDIGSSPLPINNPLISISTMSAGPSSIDNPSGGIAVAYSGNVLYYADTANNRVVIYTRGLAYKCDDYKVSDPATYFACIYQYSGAPLTAVNVLGQNKIGYDGTNQNSGKMSCIDYESICSVITQANSCDPNQAGSNSICEWVSDSNLPNGGSCTAYKRCLTSPTKVSVSDDRLFISDSGNNRIVMYYNPITATNKQTLPIKGHVKDNGSGIIQSIDGSPVMVIGKKGLMDQTVSYPIGKSSLKNPGGVVTKGNDLYIADTGNNRVVKIKNYLTDFDCESSPDEWGNLPTDSGYSGGKCQFTSLLGQKTFFDRWSFKEGTGILGPNDVGYDGIKCTNPTPSSLYCDSPYILYNQSCSSFLTQNSCIANSACNWIQNSPTVGSCSLKPEANLRNIFDQANVNKPGAFMSRYFRSPTQIAFTTAKNESNQDIEVFLVNSNEDSSITSPLGKSEVRGRILGWLGSPFPDTAAPTNPPPLDKCYAGDDVDNFDVPTSKCHADFVIGQENFNTLAIIPSGGNYSDINFGLKALNSFSVKSNMLFAIDGLSNQVYYWDNFLSQSIGPGKPPLSKVLNPNGRINPNTGRYLPVLQGLSDMQITDTNLIYISDPLNSHVYEIRAYDYEQAQ